MKQVLKVSAWVMAAALSLGATGAMAASGYRVTKAQEAQIKIGMSTDDVRIALGKPARIYKYRNEVGPTWTYEVVGANNATVYEVDFGKDSKVLKVNERERRDVESVEEVGAD